MTVFDFKSSILRRIVDARVFSASVSCFLYGRAGPFCTRGPFVDNALRGALPPAVGGEVVLGVAVVSSELSCRGIACQMLFIHAIKLIYIKKIALNLK